MSIFAIIMLSFVIACLNGILAGAIYMGPISETFDTSYATDRKVLVGIIIASLLITIGGVFIGIGLCDQDERLFIDKYEAQKLTIEQSIDSPDLTGLERLELVKTATELNGQLAEHKSKFNRWHYVYFDNDMYDGIEYINLNK